MNLFWFRRDLRWHDNKALYHALQDDTTQAIFIFDTNILTELQTNDKRISFIYDVLFQMQKDIYTKGKSIRFYIGNPIELFPTIIEENKVDKVFFNRDYEPYAVQRDAAIADFLKSKNIDLITFTDHIIMEPNRVLKDDGSPYSVYTPYSKKWKIDLQDKDLQHYKSESLMNKLHESSYTLPSIGELGFVHTSYTAETYFEESLLDTYEKTRDIPSEKTSHLGIHLRFGTVSIREIVKKSRAHPSFLNELIWREFFIQILYHFPKVTHQSFKQKYDQIQWRNNTQEFEFWKEGKTGFPLVDAGMRELKSTGFMHNRVRMLCASFLCKHLLIDWRWGEAYFAKLLLDFELASNNGNWQWASGGGCDAAPYFRIFNPTTQWQKFDPENKYIQKWIPEWATSDYSSPIVYHKEARRRAIETYQKYLQ